MPGSKKLIDILDEMNLKDNEILNKMGRLLKLIESTNPSIDDPELRWVEKQIDKYNEGSNYYGDSITKNDFEFELIGTLHAAAAPGLTTHQSKKT